MSKFRVGDRVRVLRDGYGYAERGHEGTVAKVDNYNVGVEMDYPFEVGHGVTGLRWNFFKPDEELELIKSIYAQPLTIEAGRFYKTRDGRKVGPMVSGANIYDKEYPFTVDHYFAQSGKAWRADGTFDPYHKPHPADLVAEWVEPAAEQRFKVGDRVRFRDDYNSPARGKEAMVVAVTDFGVRVDKGGRFGVSTEQPKDLCMVSPAKPSSTSIVALIENGQPKPSVRPFVHTSRDAAEAEAARLAGKHPGKSFGVFELVATKQEAKVYDFEWQRLAVEGQTIAAIKSLRSITGCISLRSAKSAVDDFIEREAA